jgi:hypothetical protein
MMDLTWIGLVVLLALGLVGAVVLVAFLINRRVGVVVLLGILALALLVAGIALAGGIPHGIGIGVIGVVGCLFLTTLAGLIWAIVPRVRTEPHPRRRKDRRTDVAILLYSPGQDPPQRKEDEVAAGQRKRRKRLPVWVFLLPSFPFLMVAVFGTFLVPAISDHLSLGLIFVAGTFVAAPLLIITIIAVVSFLTTEGTGQAPRRAWPTSSAEPERERLVGRHHCPDCGVVLPADAPEGLCPRCLLQSGLAKPSPLPSPGSTTPHPGQFVAPAPADLAPHFPQLEIL